jgi:hypothetical protein
MLQVSPSPQVGLRTNVHAAGYTAPRELLTAGDAAATSVGNASWHQLAQVT